MKINESKIEIPFDVNINTCDNCYQSFILIAYFDEIKDESNRYLHQVNPPFCPYCGKPNKDKEKLGK